jgi:hypothetical protein
VQIAKKKKDLKKYFGIPAVHIGTELLKRTSWDQTHQLDSNIPSALRKSGTEMLLSHEIYVKTP